MTAGNRQAKRDDPKQSTAFIEKAREIEADGDDTATDQLMGRMAKMKPEPRKAKKKTPAAPKRTGASRNRRPL